MFFVVVAVPCCHAKFFFSRCPLFISLNTVAVFIVKHSFNLVAIKPSGSFNYKNINSTHADKQQGFAVKPH